MKGQVEHTALWDTAFSAQSAALHIAVVYTNYY